MHRAEDEGQDAEEEKQRHVETTEIGATPAVGLTVVETAQVELCKPVEAR